MNRFFLVGSDRDSSLRFPLREGIQTIGRASDCDIALVSASVSKRHAQIELSGTQIHVRDLGSKNGTFVDETRVEHPVALRDGARLRFGTLEVVYRAADMNVSTDTV